MIVKPDYEVSEAHVDCASPSSPGEDRGCALPRPPPRPARRRLLGAQLPGHRAGAAALPARCSWSRCGSRWSAFPTLLLVPRPQVKLRWLIGTGLGIGVLQFAFLYLGMAAGMPSGLASLVLQASAPFTVLLAGHLPGRADQPAAGDRHPAGRRRSGRPSPSTAARPPPCCPSCLTLAGGLGWAIGNVCSRKAAAPNPLHLTLWMSVVPPLPMLAVSLYVEGPQRIGHALVDRLHRAGPAGGAGSALHRGGRDPARVRDLEHPAGPLPVELGGAVLDAGADRRRPQLLGAVRRASSTASRRWPASRWSAAC